MELLYLGPSETLRFIRSILPKNFEVQFALDDDSVERYIQTCDIILDAYMRIRFPADRISRAAHLKLFVTATTGSDHIDISALNRRGIPLLTLKDRKEVIRNITPAAEHSWLLLMACARRLRAAVNGVLLKEWDRNKYPGIMLRGKTIGIIGCGRIGQWVARYATAFEMKCLGFDPYVCPWPGTIEKTDLESLLKTADFISVHVPLNEETLQLLGQKEFRNIKKGAVLINTSRGEIIDESAVLEALLEGRLAAVGLDVLTSEPDIADHPIIKYAETHQNVIITPHIGGFSPEALEYVLAFSCQRIVEFFGMKR